jgi:hypothetical protein
MQLTLNLLTMEFPEALAAANPAPVFPAYRWKSGPPGQIRSQPPFSAEFPLFLHFFHFFFEKTGFLEESVI